MVQTPRTFGGVYVIGDGELGREGGFPGGTRRRGVSPAASVDGQGADAP